MLGPIDLYGCFRDEGGAERGGFDLDETAVGEETPDLRREARLPVKLFPQHDDTAEVWNAPAVLVKDALRWTRPRYIRIVETE